MLGRKAILHAGPPKGKRKWQLELDKGGDASGSDGEGLMADAGAELPPSDTEETAPKVAKLDSQEESKGGGGVEESKDKKEDSDDDDDGGKRFAWMESDDEEASAGASAKDSVEKAQVVPGADGAERSEAARSTTSELTGSAAASSSAAPAKPFSDRQALLRLPPGVKLPKLSEAHRSMMAEIATLKSIADLWELVEDKCEDFAPAHASTTLHRLTVLAAATAPDSPLQEMRLDDHSAFMRLRDRVDEILGTAEGRESFLPADLALVAVALAKVVRAPATGGCIGRIFADIADEAETRLTDEPLAFMPHMMSDLVWALARSGNAKPAFLRSVVSVAVPRLAEMTCQDLANFASALASESYDEAEVLLTGVVKQAKLRLTYQPAGMTSLSGGCGVVPTQIPGHPAPAPHMAASNGGAEASLHPTSMAGGCSSNQPLWQRLGQWRFTGNQISEIMFAMANHIGLYDEALFNTVALQFLGRLSEFNLMQLTKLRDAYELVKHPNAHFLLAVRTVLKQRSLHTTSQPFRHGRLC
mmetsp:Transcript_63892/g.152386  ORF Transcript_63892/g.152386 Transcript_63892/m.152386 type:complete len:530 (-) Transcript_63892:122-1711(-)